MPGTLNLPNEALPTYFSSYIKTYIERDVRLIADLKDIKDFADFMGIMSTLSAQEINYRELGREIGITGVTAKRWTALLEQTYQWRDVSAFSNNPIKKVILKRKGYLTDTGLACHLQHIGSPDVLSAHPRRGALFETYMANTIQAVLDSMTTEPRLYHWRTAAGGEVDLIIAQGSKLYPIEIKLGISLNRHDARSLKAFREAFKNSGFTVMPGVIVYAGDTCYRLDEQTTLMPWNAVVR